MTNNGHTGAGATATTEVDWHEIWSKSDEAKASQKEIDDLLAEGRARPPVQTEIHTEFTTGWLYQVKTLLKRDLQRRWRDPQYVVAKLALNVFAGLFIGFTFWKSKWTIQGTQNKLFVSLRACLSYDEHKLMVLSRLSSWDLLYPHLFQTSCKFSSSKHAAFTRSENGRAACIAGRR